MRIAILTLILAMLGAQTARAEHWVVEARYPDRAALVRAAAHFQHVRVDRKRSMLVVDTDESGIAMLEREGLAVGIDSAATARLRGFEATLQAAIDSGLRSVNGAGYASIPGYACYRTVEGTYATMDDLAAAYPGLVEIHEIGPTWKKEQDPSDGYEMRALRITNLATADADPDRPAMVVFGSIHAREYAPAEIVTRFAEWLVHGYGSDPEATWLVDHNDFRLILQANPDGRKDAEQQIYQRKNLNVIDGPCGSQDSFSQPGIDLNRNFPFHWDSTNGQGSSGFTCDQTFRGPVPQSEPETDNLVRYVAGNCNAAGECTGGVFADRRAGPMNPDSTRGVGDDPAPEDTTGFFLDMHSYAELVLWSWGDTFSASPNDAALRTLGRRIAWFNDYVPQTAAELYLTDGTTDDTFYGLLGVPSYTIETDVEFFEGCGAFEARTAPDNIAALRYAARNLHAPYQLPSGPDAIDVLTTPDLVAAGDPVTLTATIDDDRFSNANGSEAHQDIVAASAYVDSLPWADGAVPIALDGAFQSATEPVSGEIPTAGLADGRHLVFVQGRDASGSDGTPNAAFIEVAAADHIGLLRGTTTSFVDDAPVVATVTATNPSTGETRTTSSRTDGSYERNMLAGTIDLQVSAPGYLTEQANGIVLAGGDTVQHSFHLLPKCTLLDNDVESGTAGWTAQSPWVITGGVPGNATQVWDTPNYGNDLSRSLTSPVLDLSGYAEATLTFDDRCATEAGYDYGYVEASADGGATWSVLSTCNGRTTWQPNAIALPASTDDAASVQVRFRLDSDVFVSGDGWAVDNIRIEAGGEACRAEYGPLDIIFEDDFDGPQ